MYSASKVELDFVAHGTSSIEVDLTPLQGKTPTAVRYAWGVYDCCDLTDPLLWRVTSPCGVGREGGQSLVIGGPSLVILEGKACNPL